MKSSGIPQHFCWTKFGSEAGEGVTEILGRKDGERAANGGLFLWGVGNSVARGIKALVRLEKEPTVIFSPMRAKAKAIDVAPRRVVLWRSALGIDGQEWNIPPGSTVTSRGDSSGGAMKRSHYALVCRSDTPLSAACFNYRPLQFGSICNLLSGSQLGFSQVTSVVGYRERENGAGPLYPVGFLASLVYPYFVELFDPISADEKFAATQQSSSDFTVNRPVQLALR
jgi:hypothetical protein